MRAVVQRVEQASVSIGSETVGRISAGLLVLLGVAQDDDSSDLEFMKRKLVNLRIFEDASGKMNRSVMDVQGALLVVSQFTVYGDCRKGHRPSFIRAALPEKARALYEQLVRSIRDEGIQVETGEFQAMMKVSLVNDGPVTVIVDTP